MTSTHAPTATDICKNPERACDYEAHVKLPKELLDEVPAPKGREQVDLFASWADKREPKYAGMLR